MYISFFRLSDDINIKSIIIIKIIMSHLNFKCLFFNVTLYVIRLFLQLFLLFVSGKRHCQPRQPVIIRVGLTVN